MIQPGSLRVIVLLRECFTLREELVRRGKENFFPDRLLHLSAEALILRVGHLAKQLSELEPRLKDDLSWSNASRTRDFFAHHYHAVDTEQLWSTVTDSLAELERSLDAFTGSDRD